MAALAAGPFLYRSLVPAAAGASPAGCSFMLVTGGLFALLLALAIWRLRRGRRTAERRRDRQLWRSVMGSEVPPPADDEDRL